MDDLTIIRPTERAEWRPDRMGKSTLFESTRVLVGLNAFEPGQFHALHHHEGMDKVYHVVEGEGTLLLDGRELPMKAGDLVAAPEGVPHGIRNTSGERLLVLDEHVVDGIEQSLFLGRRQVDVISHPRVQLAARVRRRPVILGTLAYSHRTRQWRCDP